MKIKTQMYIVFFTLFFTSCVSNTNLKNDVFPHRIADVSEFSLGKTFVHLYNYTRKEEYQEMEIRYNPKEDFVIFEYKNSGNKEKLIFDRDARSAVIEGYSNYSVAKNSENSCDCSFSRFRTKVKWGAMTAHMFSYPQGDFICLSDKKGAYYPALSIERHIGNYLGNRIWSRYMGCTLVFDEDAMKQIVELLDREYINKQLELKTDFSNLL